MIGYGACWTRTLTLDEGVLGSLVERLRKLLHGKGAR